MSRPGAAPGELLAPLTAAVLEVGVLLREWRADADAVRGVWEGSQFKAEADARAHRELSGRLSALAPDVPVLSEEDAASQVAARPERHWLIDPIDGTASYVHGFPGYVTQAALMEGGRPVLAALYAPENDVMYAAVRGLGATRNGVLMPRLEPAPVGAGALVDNTPEPRGIAAEAYAHFGFGAYRECGSIALKLCRVAEGAAGLFIKDVPVRDWDVAAPLVVLEEAGAGLVRLDGTPFDFQGGYESTGLIGASSPAACAEVARWWRGRAGRG